MSNTILDLVKKGESVIKFDDGKKIRTEEWSIDDFLKLDPFTRNRPVENRVKKKRQELKKKFLLTHLEVKVGRAIQDFGPYKKGDLYVADGNTRSLVWRRYPELKPNQPLMVTIMDFDSLKDSEDTYYSIDSSTSVETSQEKIGGYFRSIGYTPISKKMREGKITTTVTDATKFVKYFGEKPHKDATVFDKIAFVWEELKFLDQWNLDSVRNLSSSLLSCIIMVAKKYGVNDQRFLRMIEHIKYGTSDLNSKDYCDGVHYVMVCLFTDNTDKWGVTGHKKCPELLYEMLFALDSYMKNNPLKKKKNNAVTKSSKHREMFQTYLG